MIVRQLLKDKKSALAQAIEPDLTQWGTTDYLLALIADNLQAANWQRGGGKTPMPKPIERPKSVNEVEEGPEITTTVADGTGLELSDEERERLVAERRSRHLAQG